MPELQFDLARNAKQATQTSVPAGDSTKAGYRLTWVGPGPNDFDWVQDSEGQILKGVGDPNGLQFAPKTTLYLERTAPALWINNDGLTGWELVGSAGSAVSSYYNGGSPVTTPVATATLTNLDWPTLSIGPAVLDLSTIDTPITVSAGEHTFNVTVAVSAGEAPGESVLVVVRISDGTTPYGADVTATVLGNATHDCVVSISHTAVVAAGSTVEVAALQSSGSTVDVRFDQVAVTGPTP